MTDTIVAIREAFQQGESAALESGWLCNALLESHITDNAETPPRQALHECLNILQEELREVGIARNTIADRIRVTHHWTRDRYEELPVKDGHRLGYHHLRATLGQTEEETEANLGKVLAWMDKSGVFPKVEEIRSIVDGKPLEAYERARKSLIKAARKVFEGDPSEQWRLTAQTLLDAVSTRDGGRYLMEQK